MAEKYNKFLRAIKKSWYIQGCNGVPIFLSSAAVSGFTMKKDLGYCYSNFLFIYKNGYGEMWYLDSDLKRLWNIIKEKISKDPDYLKKSKEKYDGAIKRRHLELKKVYDADFKRLPDKELLGIFKESVDSITYAVGVGHMVEPIGIEIEAEFKKELFSEIADKSKLNQYFAALSNPEEMSFIAQEEADLEKISNMPAKQQKRELQKHLQEYFWIQNSYAGAKNLDVKFFERQMKLLRKQKMQKREELKNDLIKRLGLSRKIKQMADIVDLTTIWQDQRKKNVLKSISYTEKAIDEISRRTKVDARLIFYLCPLEALAVKSLDDIRLMVKELKTREKGVFLLMEPGKEFCAFGADYIRLIKERERLSENLKQTGNELNGSVANRGTAFGRVVVCKNFSDIKKVKQGDILVTSMTRPEYMSAIKKAAAIVTDEGGITSHAAIISRELNIPAVIGTKMATKVLKDGMIVEVRANHGLVRIMK